MKHQLEKISRLYKIADHSLMEAGPVGAGIGIAIGACVGYNYGSEYSVWIANQINNFTHLLAPLSGLVQIGLTGIGAAAGTSLGMFAGVLGEVGLMKIPHLLLQKKEEEKRNRNIQILNQMDPKDKPTNLEEYL